jgi:regulator of replication initiation timing
MKVAKVQELVRENRILKSEIDQLEKRLKAVPSFDRAEVKERALHFLKRAAREWGETSPQSKKIFHSSIGAAIALAAILARNEDSK